MLTGVQKGLLGARLVAGLPSNACHAQHASLCFQVEPKRPITHFPRPNLKPMVKPKTEPSKPSPQSQHRLPGQQQQGDESVPADGGEPEMKRPKLEAGAHEHDASKGSNDGEGGTLAGLLGTYGSDSEADS